MIQASAPGNVFFLGEHSVVYGRPAIVAAIDKRTYSAITPRKDDKIIIKSEGYGEAELDLDYIHGRRTQLTLDMTRALEGDMGHLVKFVASYLRRSDNIEQKGFDLSITSDIPKNSGGMSSSTAFLCSVLAALDRFYGTKEPVEGYFDYLLPFQIEIHGGKASGAELTSSSLGGYNLVRIDRSKEKPALERENLGRFEYRLVIGDTGIEAKTKLAVRHVADLLESDKAAYENVFDEIKTLVYEGESALLLKDVVRLGGIMNQNHEILARDLGISHPRLNRLVNAARNAGAYGAKLSGGGMGGIMIALVDEEKEQAVYDAISQAGGHPSFTKVGVEGVRIV